MKCKTDINRCRAFPKTRGTENSLRKSNKRVFKEGILFSKDFIYLFIFREKGREGKRERNINVWLPLARPLLGTWPTTQACALDWESNW